VRVGGISGLLELIAERGDGLSAMPQVAERLQLEIDDLLPLLDAAVLSSILHTLQERGTAA
jgi:NitT/TauT family transport system ATP-binding protein